MTIKETKNNLKTSKLIGLLAKLPPKKVKQFKAWMKNQGSPTRDAFLVLAYLLLHFPEFESSNLGHPFAFKKIFKKAAYDYRRLMKAVSQIHLDLKRYLVQEELEADDFLSDYLLAKVYTKYDLTNERELLLAKKIPAKITPNQPRDFYQSMTWNELSYFTERQIRPAKQEERVSKALSSLDLYYVGKKLKYICELKTREKQFGKKYEIQWENELQSYCQEHFDSLPIFHKVYFLAWQLVLMEEQHIFEQLRLIFIVEHFHFSKKEQLYLLTQLLNYTSQQIRKNEKNALEVAFEIYQIGIDKNILMIDRFFIASHFKNIVAIASALKKFKWVEQFLKNYLSITIQKNDPTNYNLALARYHFAKKDFAVCLGHLIGIDYKQFNQSIRARTYQIACSYELHESPHIIESHCKSFENYLRRNTAKYPLKTKANLHFLQMVRQLNKVNPNKNKLQKSLDTTTGISFIVWLQEKIDLIK